jgi:ABC-type dipeptide/oligopeptide/nickel transport system ATPase component
VRRVAHRNSKRIPPTDRSAQCSGAIRCAIAPYGVTAISHDLALVHEVAQCTLVMYLATIVEDGPTERVVSGSLHPYAKVLVAAVPIPRVEQDRARGALALNAGQYRNVRRRTGHRRNQTTRTGDGR